MPIVHYLNVQEGDCSIIEHHSGHISVIDVCNARKQNILLEELMASEAIKERGVLGNFNQKKYPVNPITYLKGRGITSVFRFIASHPDMDHLDGIELFFKTFNPANFWDTDNREEKNFELEEAKYKEEDWTFYKKLRDENPQARPRRLTLYSGAAGKYYNEDGNGQSGGDGLQILAPTPELVSAANKADNYNDCSYVIMYRTRGHRIMFAGDSHDNTWQYVLEKYETKVKDIDLLIAPHHGRSSKRSYEFLDLLKPKMTFFGNAKSEHLAYSAWSYRNLPYITNNQAGSMIVNAEADPMELYVTHEKFANSMNPSTFRSRTFNAYYLGEID